jgi:hypothetical protein
MEDVKKVYAWQEAIALANQLARLCEEFSDGERNVLVSHLRQAVVEVPATVAADIKLGRGITKEPLIRLATAVELVHKMYPAIDTGSVPAKLDALMQRMSSDDSFYEREPESGGNFEPASGGEEQPTEEAGDSAEEQPSEPDQEAAQPAAEPRVLTIATDQSPSNQEA